MMNKRFIDKPYFTYSAYTATTSGLEVKCPKCGKMGIVKKNDDEATFKCLSCGENQTKDLTNYRYDIHNQCKECGLYYRVDITDENKLHFKTLHVNCPHCGFSMAGVVHKTAEKWTSMGEIKDGLEPFFNYPLYLQGSFDNQKIWAVNHEHLQFLIDFVGADLREKYNWDYAVTKTQGDHLPTFMKTAKNRDGVLKVLRKMQVGE